MNKTIGGQQNINGLKSIKTPQIINTHQLKQNAQVIAYLMISGSFGIK